MAAPHRLSALADDQAGLARWALGRMAATAAEDVRFGAEAECGQHRVPGDLSGRYGWHEEGYEVKPGAMELSSPARLHLQAVSTAGLRREDEAAGDPLLSLCDPARLVSGVADASGGRCAWEGERPCVEVTLVPHPWTADPEDPWLPPGATRLRVRVDTATGFLLRARAYDERGCFRSGRLRDLRVAAGAGPESAGGAAPLVLARMATAVLEPVRLSAEVEAVPEAEAGLTPASLPSNRSWSVTLPGTAAPPVEISGNYVPDQADPAAARLAELLTPARIVSHLAEVTATGPDSIEATVRPLRSFPFSAWAPEAPLTCRFTVDPSTGVLLRAHTLDGTRTLSRAEVTVHARH